jgi:hypothetical protein
MGWGQVGEMTQVLYAHMNNKSIKKKKHLPSKSEALSSNPSASKKKKK